jgi:hypothetical protein
MKGSLAERARLPGKVRGQICSNGATKQEYLIASAF